MFQLKFYSNASLIQMELIYIYILAPFVSARRLNKILIETWKITIFFAIKNEKTEIFITISVYNTNKLVVYKILKNDYKN